MSGVKRIGVVGAGLGGTAAAGLLERAGFDVRLYEQAPAFSRLGAGIHVGPNVQKIMRRLGIEDALNAIGSHPDFWYSRSADDGSIMSRIPLGGRNVEARYGAQYVTIHRGDFHEIMIGAIGPGIVQFSKKLTKVTEVGSQVEIAFEDETTDVVDLLIGADGINSKVREIILGIEDPIYTGYVGHRAIIPSEKLTGLQIEPCVKWWSRDRHMMVYYLSGKRDELYYVTGVPQAEWPRGVAWVPSSRDEMRNAFSGYHNDVQALIEATDVVTKWPLMERKPLSIWHQGRMVLLGDACHPMKPHMAQGAAMAIEDAAILVRCLTELKGDLGEQIETYRRARIERASRVQQVSHDNTWLQYDEDPSWVFGHDVYNVDLGA